MSKDKMYRQFCAECGGHVEFFSIQDAAELFATDVDDVFRLVRINGCHFQTGAPGTMYICMASLLWALKIRHDRLEIKNHLQKPKHLVDSKFLKAEARSVRLQVFD